MLIREIFFGMCMCVGGGGRWGMSREKERARKCHLEAQVNFLPKLQIKQRLMLKQAFTLSQYQEVSPSRSYNSKKTQGNMNRCKAV